MENKKKKESKTAKKTTSSKKVKTTKIPAKKKATKKKPKKRAFTLIELLAVIIILGILMIIAIPSVTSYISNSRKSGYVSTAKNLMDGARTKVNEGKLPVYDTNTTYYLPYDMIKTENASKSPYGDFTEAYVVVTYDGNSFDYYWTSTDETKTGAYLTYYNDLNNDSIISNVESVSPVAICGKNNIVVFDADGNVSNEFQTPDCVDEKGSLTKEDIENANSPEAIFEFDPSTGTILGFKEGKRSTDITIPSQIDGVDVVSIGNYAFFNQDITSVKLPNTLKSIDDQAFENNLIKNITIPSSVTSIGSSAFARNYLQKITIPSSVTTIGSSAFSENYLLYSIINKTGKAFSWGQIIGYGNDSFVTGTYTYEVSAEEFNHNNYRYYNPYKLQINISTTDSLTIDMDSIFDYGHYKFNLKNSNGYKIYSYNPTTKQYEETSVGEMNFISGYCCAKLSNFYITDNNGQILFAGFYKYYIENCAC